jgi:hypothetical protein
MKELEAEAYDFEGLALPSLERLALKAWRCREAIIALSRSLENALCQHTPADKL